MSVVRYICTGSYNLNGNDIRMEANPVGGYVEHSDYEELRLLLAECVGKLELIEGATLIAQVLDPISEMIPDPSLLKSLLDRVRAVVDG